MLKSFLLSILLFGIGSSCNNQGDHAGHGTDKPIIITKTKEGETDTIKKSLPAYVQNKIGQAKFKISYHSPAVRGRVIWGGLVPFDQVWVTGAHDATRIESDNSFVIGNTTIPAGKYAFFTIPAKDAWTVVLNKNWDQHLADEYNAADDVVRVQVKPDTISYVQERLMYDIDQWAQKEGNLIMSWEKLRLVIPVRIP